MTSTAEDPESGNPILLSDLLALPDLSNTKIRLVTRTNGFEPLQLIRQDPEALTEALLWN